MSMTLDEMFVVMEKERKRQGITQKQLSEKAGYYPTCWGQVLWRGTCSALQLIDYIDALGMKVTVE